MLSSSCKKNKPNITGIFQSLYSYLMRQFSRIAECQHSPWNWWYSKYLAALESVFFKIQRLTVASYWPYLRLEIICVRANTVLNLGWLREFKARKMQCSFRMHTCICSLHGLIKKRCSQWAEWWKLSPGTVIKEVIIQYSQSGAT